MKWMSGGIGRSEQTCEGGINNPAGEKGEQTNLQGREGNKQTYRGERGINKPTGEMGE